MVDGDGRAVARPYLIVIRRDAQRGVRRNLRFDAFAH